MLAAQLGSRRAGVQKLQHDPGLLLRRASLAHALPTTSCAKKHSDSIGPILAGSGPTTHAINSGSLKNSMDDLVNNSEAAYTMGHLIRNVVGDRDYWIDESDYNMENGVFTFSLFFADDVIMDSVLLQFGDAPLVLISASVDDVVLDNNVDFLNEIYSVLDELDDEYTFSYEWVGDRHLEFMIQIDLIGMGALTLPKMDDVEPAVRKIMEVIKNHDSRKQRQK